MANLYLVASDQSPRKIVSYRVFTTKTSIQQPPLLKGQGQLLAVPRMILFCLPCLLNTRMARMARMTRMARTVARMARRFAVRRF